MNRPNFDQMTDREKLRLGGYVHNRLHETLMRIKTEKDKSELGAENEQDRQNNQIST